MTRATFIAGLLLVASPALAQQAAAPFQMQNPNNAIATPQGRAASDTMLSTKPVAPVTLPWQAPSPVPVAAPGTQAQPAAIPFGKSTASQYQPIPEGPHTATAVPVENIDAVEASEPAPAVPATNIADPANENPAEPTEYTAPIFATDAKAPPRMALLRVLNKVTARSVDVPVKPGTIMRTGKILIKASYCQRSAETSLPDAAALLEISEIIPGQTKPKALFSGWMYQSSPSVSALEHPVYDVMLVECKDLSPEKPKSAEKPAKSKKK